MVTLAEELQFVKAYTYLLSVRYEGKLFFSIQAALALLLCYLPILSVLPLIENAVKHNVRGERGIFSGRTSSRHYLYGYPPGRWLGF